MPVPDNYALYHAVWRNISSACTPQPKMDSLALGALAGLLTLARSDGLLWLGLAGLTVMWKATPKFPAKTPLLGEG